MDHALKQRLVGAAVLVSLGVVFIPIVLDDPADRESLIEETNIPPQPDEEFSSRIVPIDNLDAVVARLDEQPITEPGEDDAAPGAAEPDAPAGPSEDADSADESGVAPRVGVTAWAVQLGSFASEKNASALTEKARAQGFNAFMDEVEHEQGTIFRVRVGPELLHAEADRLRDELAEALKLNAIVVRYR